MHIAEAIDQGMKFKLILQDGSTVQISDLYSIDGVLVAVSGAWCDPMYFGHPFHTLAGKVAGDGPWMVDGVIIDEDTSKRDKALCDSKKGLEMAKLYLKEHAG